MDSQTRKKVVSRLEKIVSLCEEGMDLIELAVIKNEDAGNTEFDYFGAGDAQEYFSRLADIATEAKGQWWA